METKEHITITQLCEYYEVPESFIDDLAEFDLIRLVSVQQKRCIEKSEIHELEKLMRLHFDLKINMEGLDTVRNLLHQVKDLQNKITHLSNKLNFHELD